MATFYMNYALGQSSPTTRFNTQDEAEKEAARLAISLDLKVYTMMAVSLSEKAPQVLKHDLLKKKVEEEDVLPF